MRSLEAACLIGNSYFHVAEMYTFWDPGFCFSDQRLEDVRY